MPQPSTRRHVLELAADYARQAPSVHDSRPWRIELRPDDRLLIRADRSRRRTALDPRGRELVLSGGAALFGVRVALAAAGWASEIQRLPSPEDPDLLAVVRPGPGAPEPALAALAPVGERRRTHHGRSPGAALPEASLRQLAELAENEGALLVPVADDAHRLLVSRMTQVAAAEHGDGVPTRNSDTGQTMVLLATRTDDPAAWLRAGETLQHLLLELTRLGFEARPITPAIEVPLMRTRLRSALAWDAHPQVLLRIGRAPTPGRHGHRTTLRDRGPGPMRPPDPGEGAPPLLASDSHPARGAVVQVRDVMTREVVTVGPDTSAKYAAELLVGRGFAALPVVDDADRLVGIVAEVDVLQDRLPADPRLHLRRDEETPEHPPPLLVRGIMTVGVRTVDAGADVSDVARLFVDDRLRSVPVLEQGRLAGIVSRRDLLASLVRPDAEIRDDLLRLVEGYTGDLGCWDVAVTEGVATIGRTAGQPDVSAQVEERAVRSLAHTVAGVVGVRVLPGPPTPQFADRTEERA